MIFGGQRHDDVLGSYSVILLQLPLGRGMEHINISRQNIPELLPGLWSVC